MIRGGTGGVVGNVFLRLPGPPGGGTSWPNLPGCPTTPPVPPLIILYDNPVSSFSGEIWDIETPPESWAVEAFERFGDPVARLGAASKIVGGGPTLNVLEQLRLQDGPLIGPDRVLSVSMAVLALLVGSALLVGFGVFDRDLSPAPKVAFGLGMLISLPYFFYVDALAPRFLLPALALVSIATAAGVLHLWRLRTSMGGGGGRHFTHCHDVVVYDRSCDCDGPVGSAPGVAPDCVGDS